MKLLDKIREIVNQPSEPQKSPVSLEKTFPVHMQDGSIENYSEKFFITDGINCFVCRGDFYHTHFDCENFQWEYNNTGKEIKAMFLKDAKKQKITECMNCGRKNYLFKHGRIDELYGWDKEES